MVQSCMTMPDIEKILEEIDWIKNELILAGPKLYDKQEPACPPQNLLALTKFIIKFRRSRGLYFGTSLFADPAWDMLLDLFLAGEEGRRVSVSSLCIGSSIATMCSRPLESRQ